MQTIRVDLNERSYDIRITTGELSRLGPFAREHAPSGRAVVVCDRNVACHLEAVRAALEGAGVRVAPVTMPPGEGQKSLQGAAHLYDALVEAAADRRTLVVALGGVVGDLAGFAAATFNRGLPLLMVPTTLLAMVDSSVGGKVGINHPRGKNLIGAFHQPTGVWIDTGLLSTLPDREYRSGLAEVVKYGVIQDAELFAYLEAHVEGLLRREPEVVRHIVARSCRLKADVVERDERELTGLRAILNYGHTFAHAFETVAGYGSWLHGEAVAAGMVCAARLAERRGLVEGEITPRQTRLLHALGLPVAPEPAWSIDEMVAVMRHDKKAVAGRLRFVLPRRLGGLVALFDDISEADVRSILGSPTPPA